MEKNSWQWKSPAPWNCGSSGGQSARPFLRRQRVPGARHLAENGTMAVEHEDLSFILSSRVFDQLLVLFVYQCSKNIGKITIWHWVLEFGAGFWSRFCTNHWQVHMRYRSSSTRFFHLAQVLFMQWLNACFHQATQTHLDCDRTVCNNGEDQRRPEIAIARAAERAHKSSWGTIKYRGTHEQSWLSNKGLKLVRSGTYQTVKELPRTNARCLPPQLVGGWDKQWNPSSAGNKLTDTSIRSLVPAAAYSSKNRKGSTGSYGLPGDQNKASNAGFDFQVRTSGTSGSPNPRVNWNISCFSLRCFKCIYLLWASCGWHQLFQTRQGSDSIESAPRYVHPAFQSNASARTLTLATKEKPTGKHDDQLINYWYSTCIHIHSHCVDIDSQ